jgi:hypothetical protein
MQAWLNAEVARKLAVAGCDPPALFDLVEAFDKTRITLSRWLIAAVAFVLPRSAS